MKKTSIIILAALFSLFLILLSCTVPIYITTAPTATSEETETPTLTPTITETPTLTPTSTYQVTPTVSVNLDGAWTIWWGTSQQRLDINFLQKEYSLVGNAATGDGNSLLFEGTISYDGNGATGTWESTNGSSGIFVMYLKDTYTVFSGNMGGGVPFCGNRLNSKMPSPCLQ